MKALSKYDSAYGNTAEIARAEVLKFLEGFKAATLATASANGQPHAATVYCIVDDDLNVYFTSCTKGRKFKNLMARPEVALVIADEQSLASVQLTGIASPVEGTEIEKDILWRLWRLRFDDSVWPVPPIKLFEQGFSDEMTVILVRPTEMVFSQFGTKEDGHYTSYFQKVDLSR